MNYLDRVAYPVNEDLNVTEDQIIRETKQLFKRMNRPYSMKDTVEGPNTLVVFDEHFIEVFREASSSECISKMSLQEKRVYWDYLNFQGVAFSVGLTVDPDSEDYKEAVRQEYRSEREFNTPELVVEALSAYDSGEVFGLDLNTCYNSVHEWE